MRSLLLLPRRGQTRAVPENVGLEQGRLRADVEVVRSYGAVHPEAWVELRFENEPTVRIVALFSGPDLSVHESVLHGLVSHPDRLEVRSSPWPQTRLEEIRSEHPRDGDLLCPRTLRRMGHRRWKGKRHTSSRRCARCCRAAWALRRSRRCHCWIPSLSRMWGPPPHGELPIPIAFSRRIILCRNGCMSW
jgi:hypothetical protein